MMQRIYRYLMSGLQGMLVLLTGAVTLAVCWGVFTRYVLQSAADWTGEFSGYCLVWITFLGSAYAIFKKTHIRFESLVEILPKPIQFIINTLFNLAMIFFVTVITFYGGKLAMSSMGDETLSLPVTKGMVYLILPVGGVLMIVGFIMELVKSMRTVSKPENVDSLEKVM